MKGQLDQLCLDKPVHDSADLKSAVDSGIQEGGSAGQAVGLGEAANKEQGLIGEGEGEDGVHLPSSRLDGKQQTTDLALTV